MVEALKKYRGYMLWRIFAITIWTTVIFASLWWKFQSEQKQSIELASNVALAYIYRDVALRRWSASHGGVYVPISEHVKPNPLLADIPERDITTPAGKKLTLINPVHVLTQIMSEYDELPIPRGNVTALPETLLNPQQNMPDQWELDALHSFNQGVTSKKEVVEIEGISYLRLMMPLFIKPKCLQCHANQNYKVGDLGGGLGVAVPMAPYIEAKKDSLNYLYISYGFFWIVGLLSILYFFDQAKRRVQHHEQVAKKLRELNQSLESLSFKDALTGIANRRSFDKALNREWKHARRNESSIALIMVDVDFFKRYNDCFGHQQGDACLKLIAQSIESSVKRSNDLVARYGGEEFVMLLPETEFNEASQLAEKCRNNIVDLAIGFESEIASTVTISLGVCAVTPQSGDEINSLLRTADRALYQAKAKGRNRVEGYPNLLAE